MKMATWPHCHSTTLQDMCTEECAMVFNIKESTTGQQHQLKMYTDVVKSTFPHLDDFSQDRFPKLLTYAMLKIGRDVNVSFDTAMVKQFAPRLSGTAVFELQLLMFSANVIK